MRFNSFWRYRRTLLSRHFASSLLRTRRNIVEDSWGRPPLSGPFMAELDVTYRCDCRCRICRRWQDPRRGELTLNEYKRLAQIFHLMGTHLVSIAGGEPLMREDIFSIISGMAGYGMAVNLCTNGLLLGEYAEPLCCSGAAYVTVSLDGASASTHDQIRGAPGSYEKIVEGIEKLMAYPRAVRPLVRVRMTVSNRNLEEVRGYYRKWDGIVDDVLLQPVHYCETAFYTGADEQAFRLDPVRLDRQLDGSPLKRDGYLQTLIKHLRKERAFPPQRCYAGILMVRVDPWGNVYPCLEQHVCVGSVREQDFRTIWHSSAFNRVRNEIAADKICRCWYNNTALINHYATILRRTRIPRLSKGLSNLVPASITKLIRSSRS